MEYLVHVVLDRVFYSLSAPRNYFQVGQTIYVTPESQDNIPRRFSLWQRKVTALLTSGAVITIMMRTTEKSVKAIPGSSADTIITTQRATRPVVAPPGVFGGYNHYDSHCRKTGRTDPGILGSYNHNNTGGHMLQPVYTTPITAHRSGLCAVSGITPCLRLLPGVRLFEFITPLVPPL